ncbi:MAG: V-type ATP synthase subunit I [Candidatus Syntropharchaeia archaeon]
MNMIKIITETKIKVLVPDHHFTKDLNYAERITPVYECALEKGVEVITAAEEQKKYCCHHFPHFAPNKMEKDILNDTPTSFMFRPARMKKIRVIAIDESKEDVIKRLHELGAVQIVDYKDMDELLDPHPHDPLIRKISSQISSINRILDFFGLVDPEESESILKLILKPSPPKKIKMKEIRGIELIEKVENLIDTIEKELKDPEKKYNEITGEISELKSIKTSVERIKSLEIDLGWIGEGDFLSVFVGISLVENLGDIRRILDDITDGVYYLGMGEGEDEIPIVIACLLSDSDRVLVRIRRAGFERIELPDLEGRPSEVIDKIDKRILELDEEKKRVESDIIGLSKKWRDQLKVYREFLKIEHERIDIRTKFGKTEKIFFLEGWVPAKKSEEVRKEIECVCNGLSIIKTKEPDEEEKEKVPVLLENPKFFKSFELLTRLYGLPKYTGVDPTVLLVPSFLLFFGIMLTDAMYGIIALALGLMLLRAGKYDNLLKDFGIILSSAGVSTMAIGALTGGWFGNLGIEYLGIDALKSVVLFDPLKDVTVFLLLTLFIGLLHLNVGIVTGIVDNVKKNGFKEIFKGNSWFIVIQPGIIFFYLGFKEIGVSLIILSLLLLLINHKAMFLFQITGSLGDLLSYARLMALGLCTSGIAMTFNVLAKMTLAIGMLGYLLAPLVFVGGHLLNWGINSLGAFVHGIRLHYVEFFSKFYEGGGDMFTPFKIEREITEVVE